MKDFGVQMELVKTNNQDLEMPVTPLINCTYWVPAAIQVGVSFSAQHISQISPRLERKGEDDG